MIDINNNVKRKEIISDLLPDLTPLIDVMFMLIVFLILTTNATQQIFDVSLPENKENNLPLISNDDAIIVTIFANNKWAINEQEFDNFNDLKSNLLEIYNSSNNKKLLIYGDKMVTMDKLMDMLTFMRSNNIEAADIVMNKK